MANQEMERALTFAGYEVNHIWGEDGHSNKHATEIFPDAMRWLWKDWPRPVKAGAGSAQLQEVLIPGEEWSQVSEGYKFTEGPAANAEGEVFFTDIPNHTIHKIGLDGRVSLFSSDSKESNGLAFGPDGRLYAAAQGSKQILAYDPGGKAEVIADGFRGNDLIVRPDGSLYATDPGGGRGTPSTVWYIGPDGRKQSVDTGLVRCNGITMSPDQSLLYVADSRSHWVYSYQIQPDGSLAHKQKYYHLHSPDSADFSGADGMKVDAGGRLYVATRLGIQVCDQPGRVTCIIPTPNGRVANLCFGGPNFDVLYATCGDRVYKRKVKVRGVRACEVPIKPPTPRL
jgi:sugar lactone lactonase YvrE